MLTFLLYQESDKMQTFLPPETANRQVPEGTWRPMMKDSGTV